MVRLRHQYSPGASNCYRDDQRIRLRRKHESATFEWPDTAVAARSAFGEDDHDVALAYEIRCITKRFDGRMRIFSIYRYLARTPEVPTQKRIPEQLLLRREPELERESS